MSDDSAQGDGLVFAAPDGGEPLRCAACGEPLTPARPFLAGGDVPPVHAVCITWHWKDTGHGPGPLDATTDRLDEVTCPLCAGFLEFRLAARRERWRKRRTAARRILASPHRWLWPARERLSLWLYPCRRDNED